MQQKTLQTIKKWLAAVLLAPPGRFELPAFRLGGGPSIQLRYGGKWMNYSVIMQKWI